uniref:IRS-type PTB domain-containing protein n=1 Tax=Periophthalmus magnuspinnatus TaxID=409849 RepID=A0A3B4ACE8_9GOBI
MSSKNKEVKNELKKQRSFKNCFVNKEKYAKKDKLMCALQIQFDSFTHVTTQQQSHLIIEISDYASDLICTGPVNILCACVSQGGGGIAPPEPSSGAQDLEMSENLIYYSREEVDEFWVSVQHTDASDRCGFAGSYWLKAESDALILKEPKTKRTIQVWPYKLLRRYGRDRVMFSFEAGRRCDSGPGNFTFDTKQGNEIFSLVDQAIRSQKALAEECRLSSNPEEGPSSLQLIRDSSSTSSREADGDSGGSKPGSADGVLSRREGAEVGAKVPTASTLKGRGLPDTPAMLGMLGGAGTPPRSPRGRAAGGSDEQTGLYSEPADCVRPLQAGDALYSDPVDSIKAHGHAPSTTTPPALYSHVYDHITMELSHRTSALSLNGAAKSTPASKGPVLQEHIYDEPEGCAKGRTLSKTIYNEVSAPSGQEGHYSTPSQDKQSPPSSGSGRALPKGNKWAKPLTAPKPARGARKEPTPPSGKYSNVNNNNSVRTGGRLDLYSRVSKQKLSCYSQQQQQKQQRAEWRPDLIYNNLGDI